MHVIVFILSTAKIKQPVVMFCYTGISLSSQQQKQQGVFYYQIATDKENIYINDDIFQESPITSS